MGNKQKEGFIVKNCYRLLAVFFVLALAACGSGGGGSGGDDGDVPGSITFETTIGADEQLGGVHGSRRIGPLLTHPDNRRHAGVAASGA